jgi:hypothetical protein
VDLGPLQQWTEQASIRQRPQARLAAQARPLTLQPVSSSLPSAEPRRVELTEDPAPRMQASQPR